MATILDLVGGHGSSRRGRELTLEPGEALLVEGEPGDEVYILLEGSLYVSRRQDGNELRLATIEDSGSVVGEISPLSGTGRTATVTAAEPCRLIELGQDDFDALVEKHPGLATDVAEAALDRAEQGELAVLFAAHFGIAEAELVARVCGEASWRRLRSGEVLLRQGDPPDSIYFVVRGRLTASRLVDGRDVPIGTISRGEVVGETGLLDDTPRNATLTATRNSVLASIGRESFFELLAGHPRLIVDLGRQVVRRSRGVGPRHGTTMVVAVAVCDRFDGRQFGHDLFSAIPDDAEMLTAERVDALLETPGISMAGPASLHGIMVGKLLEEAELAASHLLLDMGREPTSWSQRAGTMADRVMVVLPPDPTLDEEGRLRLLLERAPSSQKRTLVVLRDGASAPTRTHELFDRFQADDVIHLRRGSGADMGRLARLMVGGGTGLVLGGGGARGIAHLGVYRAFEELGIPVDAVGGTSMGSILGVGIADEYAASVLPDIAQELFSNVLDYTVPMVALVKGERIAKAAIDTFGDRRIEDLRRNFFCLSTNLTTSRSHVHRRGSIAKALRASSAIPGVMPPVPFGDDLLVDGGLLNNLPVDVMRELIPAGDLIAVDVAPVRGPRATGDFGLSVSGWSALRSTVRGKRSPYPRIAAVLMRSMTIASQRERDIQVSQGTADCYLDLDLRGVSMLQFDDVHGIERRGYDAAMPRLESWLADKGEPASEIGPSSGAPTR